jgi:hypothetical protein
MTEHQTPENTADQEPQPALGVHVVLMSDGQFGIQATGEPNLGEMVMLLSRALESVKARMVAESVAAIQSEKKIITPTRFSG